MKIRIEQSEMADVVAWTTRALPTRPTTPVLAGVHLVADDSLQLSAFDLELASRASVDAVVSEPGTAVVSGRLLADITKALPKQPVELHLEGTRLVLRCGRSTFGLPTLPVEEYPALPASPDPLGSVAEADLATAISQVAIAASRDDTLPMLTGIRLELDNETITMAATDRYRLAVKSLPWSAGIDVSDRSALIKAKQLADLGRSLGAGESVSIALAEGDGGLMGFFAEKREVITRLLHGDFPDYRRLLPKEAKTTVLVSRDELVEATKRVKLVAADRTAPIKLAFSDGEVLLRAGVGDDASASESLECEITGDAIEIAFNPDYLLDGLGALDSDNVHLSFTEARKPAVLTEPGSMDFQYLLMPMRLGG